MGFVILASSGLFGSASPTFVVFIGSLLLLSARAWIGVKEVALSHRLTFWLNGLLVMSLVLFGVLVFVRFRTFG